MTGTLTLKEGVYTDAANTGALNCNNSNIYGVNGIYFADLCDNSKEGIQFYNTATTVDSLWAKSGVLYFTPSRTLGSTATDRVVLHSGNYSTYCAPMYSVTQTDPGAGSSLTTNKLCIVYS